MIVPTRDATMALDRTHHTCTSKKIRLQLAASRMCFVPGYRRAGQTADCSTLLILFHASLIGLFLMQWS